jgi:hypothetical protein
MLPFLGWGEAALDVRLMGAHQGRQDRQGKLKERGTYIVAMRPPGDRAVTGDRRRTPLYNGPNARKMRLSITLTSAVTPPTLQVTAHR